MLVASLAVALTAAAVSDSVITRSYALYGPSAAELVSAKGDLDRAVAIFESYLGTPAGKIAVVVFREPQDMLRYDFARHRSRGMRVLPWVPDRSDGLSGGEPRLLAHEACHLMFMGYVDARLDPATAAPLPSGERRYGHPRIADWLDEAVATLCEPLHQQSYRHAWLSARLAERIPLAELFAMEHPALARLRDQMNPDTTRVPVVRTSFTGEGDRLAMFYAESLMFARFVMATDGRAALPALVEAVLAGRTVSHDLAALETRWVEWLRRRAAN